VADFSREMRQEELLAANFEEHRTAAGARAAPRTPQVVDVVGGDVKIRLSFARWSHRERH